MKNLKLVVMSMIMMLMYATIAQAQPSRDHMGGERRGAHPEHLMHTLELTEEQQAQVEQLHLAMEKRVLPIENELGEKTARLKTLMHGGSADQDEIFDMIDEIGLLETSIKKQRMANRLAVRDLLTEEQKIRFDRHAPGRGGRMDGHGARHGK